MKEKIQTLETGASRKKKNRACGFTLIELVVVLLIIGLFSSLISIHINRAFSDGDLGLASRIIIAEIKDIRAKAAVSHKPYILAIGVGQNRSYVIPPKKDKASFSVDVEIDEKELSDKIKLPRNVVFQDVIVSGKKIQQGEALIRFYPDGCVDRAIIHLRNQDAETYTLKILPLTGEVRIHEGYIEERMG